MGVYTGAIRFRRYEVEGKLPPDWKNVFETRIRAHAFEPFGDADVREEAVGWVAVDDLFDTDLHPLRWLVGNTISLTLRSDVRRVPAVLLKYECRKMEAEWKEREQRERLSRPERDEIKTLVTRRLSTRALPSIRGIDFHWDFDRSEVLFFSSAEKPCESFRELFEKTFELKLNPVFPYSLALKALGDDRAAAANAAQAATFAPARS